MYKTASSVGVLLVALGAALWGTDAVLRVPVLGTLEPLEIVFCEHVILLCYSIPVLLWGRKHYKDLSVKHWGVVLFIAWGGSGLATLMFTGAFRFGNPNTVMLLQKMQPMFAIVMARLILREQLPLGYWPCAGIGLAGAYLLTFGFTNPFTGTGNNLLVCGALALGASFLWGSSTVMGRYCLKKIPFQLLTGFRFFFALPFLTLLMLFNDYSFSNTVTGALTSGTQLLLLAFLPGMISLLVYYKGLSSTKASVATIAELAFPVTTILLNWLVLGKTLNAGQWLGLLLVWLAVTAVTRCQVTEKEINLKTV